MVNRSRVLLIVVGLFGLLPRLHGDEAAPNAKAAADEPQSIRCAVIGGMMDTNFWPEVAARFEKQTGHHVDVVAHGPKQEIAKAFVEGNVDLITMHASDTIINLVADGLAENPQPWARNDLLLVGPPTDPAGVRGEKDAVEALRKIIGAECTLLVHASLGANEVLKDVLAAGDMELDAERTIVLPGDKHRQLLRRAAEEKAYTLVGRIPFLNGKIANDGLEIMVQGDPRLRRPYVVVVASRSESGRRAAAAELAAFLRSAKTQRWIADFGRGVLDDRPLFFPVVVPADR